MASSVLVMAVASGPGLHTPGGGDAPGVLHADASRPQLRPTVHPPLSRAIDDLWLIPAKAAAPSLAVKGLAKGVELVGNESFAEARPLVSQAALDKTPVADYARYYAALVHLRTGAPEKARAGFRALAAKGHAGVLGEWAPLGEAMAAEQMGDAAAAAAIFETVSARKTEQPDLVLAGLARTLAASGQQDKAIGIYRNLYLEHPLSTVSTEAWRELEKLTGSTSRAVDDPRRELERAERLFGSKRYAESLDAFEALHPLADGADRELVGLRIAEAQFYLGRYKQALDGTRPFLKSASRKAEARFFPLSAIARCRRSLGATSPRSRRSSSTSRPTWADEALNNLGTHYILIDEDETAITVFREYLTRFRAAATRSAPRGSSAGRTIVRRIRIGGRDLRAARPATSRDPTIVRRISTGRRGPTIS